MGHSILYPHLSGIRFSKGLPVRFTEERSITRRKDFYLAQQFNWVSSLLTRLFAEIFSTIRPLFISFPLKGVSIDASNTMVTTFTMIFEKQKW